MSTATDSRTFVVTLDWVMNHTDSGLSLTRDQVQVLGDTWPVQGGWKHRWPGRVITQEQKARFEERLKRGPARRAPVASGSLF